MKHVMSDAVMGQPTGGSAGKWIRQTGPQPALSHRKQTGSVARREGGAAAENTSVVPLPSSMLQRKRSSESTALGQMCRWQDDVWAYGDGEVCDGGQSGVRNPSGPA